MYNYDRAFSAALSYSPWKRTPNGYEIKVNGQKVELTKQNRTWVVLIGNKTYEIKTRRPSLDHAEAIIKQHFEGR